MHRSWLFGGWVAACIASCILLMIKYWSNLSIEMLLGLTYTLVFFLYSGAIYRAAVLASKDLYRHTLLVVLTRRNAWVASLCGLSYGLYVFEDFSAMISWHGYAIDAINMIAQLLIVFLLASWKSDIQG